MTYYLDSTVQTGDIVCVLRSQNDWPSTITLHDDLDPTELVELIPSKVERQILTTRLRLWLTEIEKIDAEADKKTDSENGTIHHPGILRYEATWEKA